MNAPELYYGVVCAVDGNVRLTPEQYREQMGSPGSKWQCPICGRIASWDDKGYDASCEEVQAYETMKSYGAGVTKLATIKELYDTTKSAVGLKSLLNMDFSALEQRVLATYPDPAQDMLTVGPYDYGVTVTGRLTGSREHPVWGCDAGSSRGDFSVVSYRSTGGRSLLREQWEARCKEAARLGYEPEPDDD